MSQINSIHLSLYISSLDTFVSIHLSQFNLFHLFQYICLNSIQFNSLVSIHIYILHMSQLNSIQFTCFNTSVSIQFNSLVSIPLSPFNSILMFQYIYISIQFGVQFASSGWWCCWWCCCWWCCCCCDKKNCSHPIWIDASCQKQDKHKSQSTDPGIYIHYRNVIMSRVGCTSALYETESIAHSETGTGIFVILHKTLNLTPHNGIPGGVAGFGAILSP